jgi:hypothetical protein
MLGGGAVVIGATVSAGAARSVQSAADRVPVAAMGQSTALLPCKSSQLLLSQVGNPVFATGNAGGLFAFTNRSSSVCTLQGYPTFRAYSLTGKTRPQVVHHGVTYVTLGAYPRRAAFVLKPGQKAYFAVGWHVGQAPKTCLGSSTAATTHLHVKSAPPGNTRPLITDFHTVSNFCAPLTVNVVAPPSTFPGVLRALGEGA